MPLLEMFEGAETPANYPQASEIVSEVVALHRASADPISISNTKVVESCFAEEWATAHSPTEFTWPEL